MKPATSKNFLSSTALNQDRFRALVELGRYLKGLGYDFTAITPTSHARVFARPSRESLGLAALRDLLGWSRVVPEAALPAPVLYYLRAADALEDDPATEGYVRSRLRVARLGDKLFFHSAFPTDAKNAVFFGPDSYRFVRFLKAHTWSADRIVDIGCGSGVGGLSLAHCAKDVELADVSDDALELAAVNSALNGVPHARVTSSDILQGVEPGADVLIANPPFIMDDRECLYSHGGGDYGTEIAMRIVRESLEYLQPAGRLLLYTGACVVEGVDQFKARIETLFAEDPWVQANFTYYYDELDPDIFGEELSKPAYADVERVAAVGLSLRALLRKD